MKTRLLKPTIRVRSCVNTHDRPLSGPDFVAAIRAGVAECMAQGREPCTLRLAGRRFPKTAALKARALREGPGWYERCQRVAQDQISR